MVGFGRRDESTEHNKKSAEHKKERTESSPKIANHSAANFFVSHELPENLKETRDQLFEQLIAQIDLRKASQMLRTELKAEIDKFIAQYSAEKQLQLTYVEQSKIVTDIVNDMIGLGPLDSLFHDPSISDILVNGPLKVYVERMGKLEKTNVQFRDERHLVQIAQRIASQAGRRVDESSPLLDTRLKDGSRINIVLPPIALDGATLSIRRFFERGISLESLVEKQSMSERMLEFFRIVAYCRLNIIVSGGTGSGKTTMLNGLSQLIDPHERVVTIEDAAELRLHQPHVVRLETRPANIEGEGTVTIRDLVQNALRMRPDRLIIGECRGSEAFDMLQAMNTGHDGSMSTLHANTGEEAINRLENMVMMAGFKLPVQVIRSYIAGAVHLIVQVARMRDGVRRVTQVIEVLNLEAGEVQTRPLFHFRPTSNDGSERIKGVYECLGHLPSFLSKVEYYGLGDRLRECLT